MKIVELPEGIGELSEEFEFNFENTGVMKDGVVYTTKTMPKYEGNVTTLGDIMEKKKWIKVFYPKRKVVLYKS